MNKLFAYEGWYYRIFSFIANLIIINFLFLITCITGIFSGVGLIALYRTIYRLYREKDIPVLRTFWTALKNNIMRGFILTGVLFVAFLLGGIVVTSLLKIATSLGFLAIFLLSFVALFLTSFLFLFSVFNWSVKKTLGETVYVVLSNSANAIILFILPLLTFVFFYKLNLFLYIALGFGTTAFLQVAFFQKVLGVEHE